MVRPHLPQRWREGLAQLILDGLSSPARLRFGVKRANCISNGIRGRPSPGCWAGPDRQPLQRLPKRQIATAQGEHASQTKAAFSCLPACDPNQNPTCSSQPPGCPCESPARMPDEAAFPGVLRDPSRPESSREPRTALERGAGAGSSMSLSGLRAGGSLASTWHH